MLRTLLALATSLLAAQGPERLFETPVLEGARLVLVRKTETRRTGERLAIPLVPLAMGGRKEEVSPVRLWLEEGRTAVDLGPVAGDPTQSRSLLVNLAKDPVDLLEVQGVRRLGEGPWMLRLEPRHGVHAPRIHQLLQAHGAALADQLSALHGRPVSFGRLAVAGERQVRGFSLGDAAWTFDYRLQHVWEDGRVVLFLDVRQGREIVTRAGLDLPRHRLPFSEAQARKGAEGGDPEIRIRPLSGYALPEPDVLGRALMGLAQASSGRQTLGEMVKGLE